MGKVSMQDVFTCARRYKCLDPAVLPRLWLVYAEEPSDSGAVHTDVRQRWQRGDADVAEAMTTFARIAETGRWGLWALIQENLSVGYMISARLVW